MTDAVMMNMIQQNSKSFEKNKKQALKANDSRSFAETMNEVNQRKNKSIQNKSSDSKKLNDDDFLEKLKKIVAKNNKEVPAELLAFVENGNLSDHQRAMLENLIINLRNNNLDIADMKSILAKNSDDGLSELQFNAEEAELNISNIEDAKSSLDTLFNPEKLEKLADLIKQNDSLTAEELETIDSEINKFVESLSAAEKFAADKLDSESAFSNSENLEAKIRDLAVLITESDTEEILNSEFKEEFPILAEIVSAEEMDLSLLNGVEENTIFAEYTALIKEVINEKQNSDSLDNSNQSLFNSENQSSILEQSVFSDLNLNSDSAEEDSNFFDLSENNSFINLDFQENNEQRLDFSLDKGEGSFNTENLELESQVVEKFRGEYSPETKEMQLQLEPESLGKIDITLSYENEELIGKMMVENELVRSQLENSINNLKNDLIRQGINIEQFRIETARTAPQEVEQQAEFAFEDQSSAFSDGETGHNQEFEQRKYFDGQYYYQKAVGSTENSNIEMSMVQQDRINRAAFLNDSINLLA